MSQPAQPFVPESQRILESFMDYSGLNVLRERESVFQQLLLDRMEVLGYASLQRYEQALQEPQLREQEYQGFAVKLTIGETYFMRHSQVFDALREAWSSELEAGRIRPYRIWSAAASIGCEAYSINILLEELKQRFPALQRQILASDLNQDFLKTAREARYGDWSFRSLDPGFRNRYFQQQGTLWELRPELRQDVQFFFCNLLADFPAQLTGLYGQLDALFCRNVLIYFDPETIRSLAKRFFQMLAPGGWLVLGPSENNWEIFGEFEAVTHQGAVLYRKPDGKKPPARLTTPVTLPSMPPSPAVPVRTDQPKTSASRDAKADHSREHIRSLLSQGKREEALRCVKDALVTQDLNPEYHMLSGYIEEAAGEVRIAGEHYKRALFLDREHPAAQFLQAQLGVKHLPPKVALRQLRIARSVLESAHEECLWLPLEDLSVEAALRILRGLEDEVKA